MISHDLIEKVQKNERVGPKEDAYPLCNTNSFKTPANVFI